MKNTKVISTKTFDNLDSSSVSDTSPSAPRLTSSTSQTVLKSHSRNVTTPPTRPISNIFDTSSTKSYSTPSETNRPPISEIPIKPPSHSHSSPINTPLVHIPNPESVAKYKNYEPQKFVTAIKTARLLPPQLDLVQITKPTYSTDVDSSTTSQIYPTLKPLKTISTSLSNLLDDDSTQEYKPSQDTIYTSTPVQSSSST